MHFDASRSLSELGLRIRPVEQSLADAVAWFSSAEIHGKVSENFGNRRISLANGLKPD
jgi:hypothetical protein